MSAGSVGQFPARDGLELVYRTIGRGRPLILRHRYTSSGQQFLDGGLPGGLPGALAQGGYRVILPDLCAHGDSPYVTAAPRASAARRASRLGTVSRIICGKPYPAPQSRPHASQSPRAHLCRGTPKTARHFRPGRTPRLSPKWLIRLSRPNHARGPG